MIIMKVIHTIPSIDEKVGGPATYIMLLANELTRHINPVVLSLQATNPVKFSPKVELFSARKSFPGINCYSSGLKHYLYTSKADLFHANGLWQYPEHALAKAALHRKLPYVLSPHGQLMIRSMTIKKWKKSIALRLYVRKDVEHASCIHATSRQEAENIRHMGFTNPIAIIPNGIELSDFPLKKYAKNETKYTVLFLSRVHAQKGLDILLEAWQNLDKELRQTWQLEIAGNGDPAYLYSLQQSIAKNNLQEEVHLSGALYGPKKITAYHRSDLFVLPSYSENFGIVVAEALACGVPVITTKGTPWEELETHHAGWWIEPETQKLGQTLDIALRLSQLERRQMGLNGRQLIENCYSIQSVAAKMIRLYEWLLKVGEKPEFMY